MGEDFLHQPLGQQGSRATGPRRRAPVVAGSVVVVMALAAVAWTALRPADQRLAPRSGVVAAIVQPKPPIPAAPPAQVPSQAPAAEARNLAQADSTGDIRVVRPPGSSTTFGKFIEVPQDATTTVGLVPAPDPRLLELTSIGPLPRRGTDGAQAAEVYARPATRDGGLVADAPRLALLVEGFGRNAALTARAANELPPEVTFGFSSYGDDLDQQVRAVRAAGHEVMLQLSSDGTGAPAPGAKAHVLTTGLDSKDMLERLHWQMSRFTGYVGVAGRFDGSFAGDRPTVQPVLQDVASRGLFFIDDGKATPSVASQVPADANRPPKRGEPIFTGTDDGGALDRLVQRAGTDRCAIGIAGAAPETVAQVVAFSHSLEARGFTLVPVSTCAASPRNATAQVQP